MFLFFLETRVKLKWWMFFIFGVIIYFMLNVSYRLSYFVVIYVFVFLLGGLIRLKLNGLLIRF